MGCEGSALLLALLCLGLVVGYPNNHKVTTFLHNAKAVQMCGTELAYTISWVCQGKYNTLIPETTTNPFISAHEANSMLRYDSRRKRRGVSDECCKKPCSLDELRSFCKLD